MPVGNHLHSIHLETMVATVHRADPARHDASFLAAPYVFAGSRHSGRPPVRSGSSRPGPSSKRVYGRLKAFISYDEFHIPTKKHRYSRHSSHARCMTTLLGAPGGDGVAEAEDADGAMVRLRGALYF